MLSAKKHNFFWEFFSKPSLIINGPPFLLGRLGSLKGGYRKTNTVCHLRI